LREGAAEISQNCHCVYQAKGLTPENKEIVHKLNKAKNNIVQTIKIYYNYGYRNDTEHLRISPPLPQNPKYLRTIYALYSLIPL